ncbi:MAG: hypothetical protein HY886_05425 [Deltaproteobacteria bacterium]|nr:hypothetical protein [Deltaproteobacteria bacterium]
MSMKNIRYGAVACASVIALTLAGCGNEKPRESAPAQSYQAPASVPAPSEGNKLPEGHPAMPSQAGMTAKDAAGVAATAKAMHPSESKQDREVKLSKEVLDKWKEAKIEVQDVASKAKESLTIKVGSTVALKKAGFKLKLKALVPDYLIKDKAIESRSNEPKNPAIFVELAEGDKTIASGWIFRNMPDFNSYKDARITIVLISPGVDKKK